MRAREDAVDAAGAVERVLRAERDAVHRIAAASAAADEQRARARDEARAIVNVAMAHVAGWERRHGLALDARVGAMRDAANASIARAAASAHDPVLVAAVAELAARLTGAPRGAAAIEADGRGEAGAPPDADARDGAG